MANKRIDRKCNLTKGALKKVGLKALARTRLVHQNPEAAVKEAGKKQEALHEEQWLSCQTDINKLVQRNGPKDGPLFSSEESDPDEDAGDVDNKRIFLNEPVDIIAEELNPEEKHMEKKDIIIAEWVIHKQLCRCCHAEGNFTGLAELAEAEDCSYDQMLLSSFNIQLFPVVEASALRALCGLCVARLRDARAFHHQVLAAERHFRELYTNNCIKVAGVDVIMEVKEELSGESDVEGDTMLKELEQNQQREKTTSTKSVKKSAPKKKKRWPPTIGVEYSTQVGDSYKCTQCDKMYQTRSDVKLHFSRIHKNRRKKLYECKHCEEKMNSPVQLTIHKLEAHKIDERYKCNACDKLFNTKYYVDRHKECYHMLGEKLKCTVCEYESYSKESLRKHLYKHRVSKDFQRVYCKKAFLRKTTLTFHERIHTGDKRKTCAECGQAFVQKASLNYHMAKYHPGVSF